jgi:hypothetical protein
MWLRVPFSARSVTQFVRYADDAVIHATSLRQAQYVLEAVRRRLKETLLNEGAHMDRPREYVETRLRIERVLLQRPWSVLALEFPSESRAISRNIRDFSAR